MYKELGNLIRMRKEDNYLILVFEDGEIFINNNKVYIFKKDDNKEDYTINSYYL